MASIIYNNIPFDPNDLSDHEPNFVLGQFMTAWSQVESLCGFLFRDLSEIRFEIATIIFDRVGTREQTEIVTELIDMIEDGQLRDMARKALVEVEALSKARNKIVHAGWGLYAGERARFWHGISTSRLIEIGRDTDRGRADRARFIFTLNDIRALTTRCVATRDAMQEVLAATLQEKWQRQRASDARRWQPHPDIGSRPRQGPPPPPQSSEA